MPPAQSYELLPRGSAEHRHDHDEFKDKPLPRRRTALFLLLRKSRRLCRPIFILPTLLVLLLLQVTFNASYVRGPPFELNTTDTVFIAANIIDGDLINGTWGKSVLELVEIIGKERVFVSIYGGPSEALRAFDTKLPKEVGRSIVSEATSPIKLTIIPHTTLPSGEERIKRIAFLAEVRNKAIEPLSKAEKPYDKLLFINDVVFDPRDATRLLWGTNVNKNGKADYKAACGTDFITSWKYYDTYATRDAEGFSIGIPIFPWFANAGTHAQSRRDVLAGRDAVGVKSCWGGIVAFDGRYFQQPAKQSAVTPGTSTLPLRFRSEPDPLWDASECCLIHADILALPAFPGQTFGGSEGGVYMNPYVRVAYNEMTFRFIPFAKRFERLFALPQDVIGRLAKLPRLNYRRGEKEGEKVRDRVWVVNKKVEKEKGWKEMLRIGGRATGGVGGLQGRATLGAGATKSKEYWAQEGHYEDIERTAERGGYCGVRQLLVLKKEGDETPGNWDNLLDQVPPLEV
ncbi:cryptococcal mannosyltransferase 1-domain-containing protein [Calycina marina]|uniref:Cryptococcal mannosyltransferase 1-domain-containing protein n=1 Tax=Calycina marina TaxID=1763456 RepID=A0A9P7Z800_9HELO|nr:cryptococcal mannosyltransferase 1-domain-containing protein [Calycina marina]